MMKNKIGILFLMCLMTEDGIRADTNPMLIDRSNPAKIAPEVPKLRRAAAPLPEAEAKTSAETLSLTPDSLISVKKIEFVGGTIYPAKSLATPFIPFIGRKVAVKELLNITQRITEKYHNDGYLISYAYLPTDNFHNGVVRVVLVEGYTANAQIKGDNIQISKRLERLARHIMHDKPLKRGTFERYTILMNRTPDTTVAASIPTPDNVYGATILNLESKHPKYWNVNTSLDSRDGDYSGAISATLSGLTPYGEQLSVATLLPFLDDKNHKSYLGLNYQQYLTDEGLLMQLRGSYYRQKPKDYERIAYNVPDNMSLEGKKDQTQYTAGVQLSYPLLLNQKEQWSVTTSLDYIDKKYDYRLRTKRNQQVLDDSIPDINQSIRYLAAEAGLNGSKIYTQGFWSTRISARQGIEGNFSHNNLDQSDLSFTRWRINGDTAYIFDEKWRLSASSEGVWSDDYLPESERVNFGGLRYGRGYPDSEASGDYGAGGQVEMRYLHSRDSLWMSSIQPYVLIDAAYTDFNQIHIPEQRLSSYAAGVTFGDGKHYSINLEAARPIGDRPSDSSRRDWRFNATFSYNFNVQ